MGIELPPELADVAAQAGVSWPEADEEAMSRSAKAWRDAATSMNSVASDADTTVRETLASVRGETGDAAAQHWSSFVEPDNGHLTATVRGMNDAADRLEHAAEQVGTAKVEIVRNLVSLAQNADAAQAAAAAGHPMALAGLDTAIRGTGVNVANIEANLVDAVQPASGVDMAAVTPPVNANPGPHAGPLQDVTALVDGAIERPAGLVADPTGHAADLVGDTGRQVDGPVGLGDGAPAGGAPGDGAPGDGGPGRGGSLVGDVVQGGTGLVDDVAAGGRNVVGGVVDGPVHGVVHGVDGAVPPGLDGVTGRPGDQATTGPVPIGADVLPGVLPGDQRPDGTSGLRPLVPGAGAEPGWYTDDRPTPPTGTTVRAGFDTAPAGPANLPPGAAGAPAIPGVPVGPAPGGGQPGGQGVAGGLGPGPVLGGPGGGGAPGGAIPGAGAAAAAVGAAPGARPVDAQPAPGKPGGAQVGAGVPGTGQPGVGRTGSGVLGGSAGSAPPGNPANQALGAQPTAGKPGSGAPGGSVSPGQPANHPGVGQAAPAPGKPGVQAAVGHLGSPVHPAVQHPVAHQPSGDYPNQPVVRERDEALALFWVHMFPIGHMPVAADRPGRQVPPPPPELDYAAGLRFEPGDHPRTELVETTDRLAALRAGAPPVESAQPLSRADLAALTEGYDPLGGEHERDWDRRYQVRFGRVTPDGIRPEGLEFAWPPCERYPEGGSAQAEAEILADGAEIDRFGPAEGRVFAEAATPFARRSLPPAHLDQGYRRYRVLRPLPVWRAVSAAWFAQPGGGIRYRTTHSAIELVALGYLADITREEP